jgi:AraC-like DNA-binding protein
VNRAIDYVIGHLAEPLRLADVARAAGVSPFHLRPVRAAAAGVEAAK